MACKIWQIPGNRLNLMTCLTRAKFGLSLLLKNNLFGLKNKQILGNRLCLLNQQR